MPIAIDHLTTRRSAKPMMMQGGPPTDAEIETMLAVAARTPDHGKLAPWRFIVIPKEAGERLGETIASVFKADNPSADADAVAFERKRLARAPLAIAVVSRAGAHPKIPEWEQVLSAGAVCMNLCHAANSLGYATNWLTEWYAYDQRVLRALGLSPQERLAGFIHIGRVDKANDERERPVLADIVTRL
jgi:nitroreductase